ncbi:MAG: non-homologous end-joining DNA ligase [Desulfitobacteriaceae bacterium]|nr:non-homologous end-joining DNA ligase [Desulfitobacteriaceae bacterium]MDD4752456.1 non-homologous end-joining DNA ligase [Desulfitobacteriaceae bacterium]
MNKIPVTIEKKEINLSNLEKILWPDDNISKAELIDYYRQVSPYLLPHLGDRPMTMKRFPDGIGGKSFYQKDCPEYAPEWIKTISVASEEKYTNYILAHDLPTLLWMANLGCIEMHPWLSSYRTPDSPSVMVFDLDPNEGATWNQVLQITPLIKESLLKFGLKGYAKTSGASGLHIYVPIEPIYSFQQVQKASGFIARVIEKVIPEIATTERTVKKRGSKVYVDYLQNARGKTIASVYSVRPRPGAPISFPVSWEEIEKGQIHPEKYHLRNVPALLGKQGDLFDSVLKEQQRIDNILSSI